MKKKWNAIWMNGLFATCEQGYGLIKQGAMAIQHDTIAWIGAMDQLQAAPGDLADHVYDLDGCCVTPGLIDCHTHLIYAGNRAHEFEKRLQGISYEEIARQGGGIQSTVSKTREVSCDELLQQSIKRACSLLKNGTTTCEIKSGYGLDWQTELKILQTAKHIENSLPLTIRKTFLGAHTIPYEYRDRPDDYVSIICNEMIPQIAKEHLADAVDVFCETIAFNVEQTERIFKAAQQYGLAIKCHADQLSNLGATSLAASYHALSVDHLEYASFADVKAMAKADTVAVLLPGAFYFLREKQLPPIEKLRQEQVPIAIATDCNPGTSPLLSLPIALNMACTLFRLTPEEALMGVTKQAAKALGLHQSHGTLTVGKAADFAVWDIAHPAELVYYLGNHPLRSLIKGGKEVDFANIIKCNAQ